MFKLLLNKGFWTLYLIISIGCFCYAILFSNLFGLAGKDIRDVANKDTYFLVVFLLFPVALLPVFILIGLLQKLKRKTV